MPESYSKAMNAKGRESCIGEGHARSRRAGRNAADVEAAEIEATRRAAIPDAAIVMCAPPDP